MAVARTCDAECRSRSISVICPRCSRVFRSSCIRRAEINHEGHDGHEEICRDRRRGLLRYILGMKRVPQWILAFVVLAASGCKKKAASTSEFASERQRMLQQQLMPSCIHE